MTNFAYFNNNTRFAAFVVQVGSQRMLCRKLWKKRSYCLTACCKNTLDKGDRKNGRKQTA